MIRGRIITLALLLAATVLLVGGGLNRYLGGSQGTLDQSLLTAIRGRHPETVSLLLERGANPNVRALPSGRPALHLAIGMNDHATVVLLLQGGANPNTRDRDGVSPLFLVILNAAKQANDHFQMRPQRVDARLVRALTGP